MSSIFENAKFTKNFFMKSLKLFFFFIAALLINSCNSVVTDPPKAENIIPLDSILIDIPSPLSNYVSNGKFSKIDPIDGGEIYEALRVYIGLAEESAELLREILKIIHNHNLSQLKNFSFVGDDGRTKEVTIVKNVSVNGIAWKYKMEIQNAGGNLGFQFFWNRTPFKALSVIDFYEMDNIEHQNLSGMKMEIKADGHGVASFQRQMEISLDNIPKQAGDENYLNKLKMRVTDFGDLVEIIGNSNHPDMILIDSTQAPGKSYSFGARGSKSMDIGIANLALPPSNLTTLQNLFLNYSLDTVIKSEILILQPTIPIDTLNVLVQNARNPGYFDGTGFLSAGPIVPNNLFSSAFVDLTGLIPFVPNDVKGLQVNFY